ncbi:LytS/YhcK type 5TM receptor domain-containing protein, partial [Thauera phenolivorans]
MFLDLLEATALLLALSLLHGLNLRVWRRSALAAQIGSGMIFGGIAVVGMMIPIEIAPGVIFDGRAVALSMAALFGGPLVGALGGAIAGAYRLALGGDGALVGTIVILAAVTAGLAYRAAVTHGRLTRAPVRLLGFGLLLHGFNLLLFLLIPDKYVGAIFGELALPYVLALAP